MQTFSAIFVAALAIATLTRLWLAWRHVRHVAAHRGRVPDAFAGGIDLAAHGKAADYTCAKTRFGMADAIWSAIVLLALTLGGILQALHDVAAGWFAPGMVRDLSFLALVGLATTAADVPGDYYRTFVIEQRFGFNRMTPALFFLDLVKSLLVGAALMLPLAAVILWFFGAAGANWWLYAWAVTVGFMILMHFVGPALILPLFNKFSPMENPELKTRVEQLIARCGFKVKGLLVMDGSRRSSHGNAFFTGFGGSKRIVFFDTLLEHLDAPEVEAVLAHELGHYKLHHIAKRMAWTAALSFGFFWLLALLMDREWFYLGLGVTWATPAMALVLFMFVVPVFAFLLQPLGAVYSRKHEFEADEYATRNASARDLASALVKMYRDNASTLTPDPLHSAFHDSHPPAVARIARLQKA